MENYQTSSMSLLFDPLNRMGSISYRSSEKDPISYAWIFKVYFNFFWVICNKIMTQKKSKVQVLYHDKLKKVLTNLPRLCHLKKTYKKQKNITYANLKKYHIQVFSIGFDFAGYLLIYEASILLFVFCQSICLLRYLRYHKETRHTMSYISTSYPRH